MTVDLAVREQSNMPLQIISETLYNAFEKDKNPSEEQLRRFFRLVAESISFEDLSSSLVERLASFTESFYNYSDLDATAERYFDLGACWGAIIIFCDAKNILQDSELAEKLQGVLDQYADLFELIEQQPGIGHSELAEKLQNSASRQSQIMTKLADLGLVSSVKRGRNKDYYLTRKARDLLQRELREDNPLYFRYAASTRKAYIQLNDSNNNENLPSLKATFEAEDKVLEIGGMQVGQNSSLWKDNNLSSLAQTIMMAQSIPRKHA